MELSELKKKLKLECIFDDDSLTIDVKVVYQCESIKPDHFSERYGDIRVKSVNCVELNSYTLYVRGRNNTLSGSCDEHEFNDKDCYLNMKAFLQNFTQKGWEIGYDTKKGNQTKGHRNKK